MLIGKVLKRMNFLWIGMFECDLSPYSQAIEDTRLQFSAEGTATFMLDDDYIAHKGSYQYIQQKNGLSSSYYMDRIIFKECRLACI